MRASSERDIDMRCTGVDLFVKSKSIVIQLSRKSINPERAKRND